MYFKFWKCTSVKSYNIYTVTSSFPSKDLLIFKTSSCHALKMSSKHLQRNNSLPWRHLAKMSWRLLEDILQTVLKKLWKTKNCYTENIFKMSWRHVLTMSWRQTKCLLGYLYLTNLYLTNLDLTNLRWIQKTLISTQ